MNSLKGVQSSVDVDNQSRPDLNVINWEVCAFRWHNFGTL